MAHSSDPVPKVLVAVDFGTSGVTAAFTLLPVDDPVHCRITQCSSLVGTYPGSKAPTAVALDEQFPHETLAFGTRLRDQGALPGEGGRMLFRNFKMDLYAERAQQRDLLAATLRPSNGVAEVPAVTVVARCLKAVYDHVLGDVEAAMKATGIVPTADEYKWVLTVPAIWGEQSKAFMRAAAVEGGMVPDQTSNQLLLALEPECAALESYQRVEALQPGQLYMVVDAGAGTLDVAVHRVLEGPDGKGVEVEEAHKATGNDMGGNKVDANFRAFLQDLFPSVDLAAPGLAVADVLDELMTNGWLRIKHAYGAQPGDAPVHVHLRDLVDEMEGVELAAAVAAYNTRHPTAPPLAADRHGRVAMPAALVRSFFTPVVAGIVAHVAALLALPATQGLRALLLVGGFASCSLLRQALTDLCAPRGIAVRSPLNPHLAVVMGAVRFGINPHAIRARRARFSYGIQVSERYIEGEHGEERKVYDARHGCYYVHKLFMAFVREGERVAEDHVVTHTLYPIHGDQDTVEIFILGSPMRDVKYVDDDQAHVFHLGTVPVPVPRGIHHYDNPCEVQMKFGSSEIEVHAKIGITTRRRTINFQSM